MTDTAIVIPVMNQCGYTKNLLDDLQGQTLKAAVVLVDNGSTDGTDEIWRHFCENYGGPTTQLLWMKNHGVARAWNAGVAAALQKWSGLQYIAILNNDLVVPPWAIEEMRDVLWADESAILCSPRAMTGGTVHQTFPSIATSLKNSRQKSFKSRALGFAFMAKVAKIPAFDDGRWFEEWSKAWFEDTDFFVRCAEAGKIVTAGRVLVHHYESVTLSAMPGAKEETEKAHTAFTAKWGDKVKVIGAEGL